MKTNKLILLLVPLIIVIASAAWQCSLHPALAATATPSATPTSAPDASASDDIQERLKNLVKEVKDNVSSTEASLRDKINQHVLVGFVGTIKSINGTNISINTKEDTLLQITTDDKTVINKNGSAKIGSLALNDKLIVIGTLIKDDILLGKRITVVDNTPDEIVSGTVVAKISSIDTKKKTISLTVNNQDVVYLLTKKASFKVSDFQVGQTLFAITKKYSGKDYLAAAKSI